jgi:hypothetical protein
VFGADLCQRWWFQVARKGVRSFRKSGSAPDNDGLPDDALTLTKTSSFRGSIKATRLIKNGIFGYRAICSFMVWV